MNMSTPASSSSKPSKGRKYPSVLKSTHDIYEIDLPSLNKGYK
jgi:hypothetical protein